jgi:Flp pilus assembly pilin Flp
VLLIADGGLATPRFRYVEPEEEVMMIKFFKDETGLELSEYAVVAALIVIATVAAFTLLNGQIAARIESLAGIIQ